eukprot:12127_1
MPRRSNRLADKQIKIGQKSRKRKRSNTNNYEPPKKRIKRHHVMLFNTNMPSNLFNNHLDQKRYETIFLAIQSSKLSVIMNIPFVIIRLLSEFATGSFKKCDNFDECKNIISVLNSHNAAIKSVLIDDNRIEFNDTEYLKYLQKKANFIINETKYFRYLSAYFCSKCINKNENALVLCSVCNEYCIDNNKKCNCGHALRYCKKCTVYCSYCDNIPICNANDEDKCCITGLDCHQIMRCVKCFKRCCSSNETNFAKKRFKCKFCVLKRKR